MGKPNSIESAPTAAYQPSTKFRTRSLYASLPDWIEDRNGNEINLTSDPSPGQFTLGDTLGRTVLASSGFGTTGNTVAIAGLSGSYTVTWATFTANLPAGYTPF